MRLLHVDTDIGGDPDDVAALAMLAGWPDAELVAVTTVVDSDGTRAAMARHCLRLVGLPEVPVVAGARTTSAGRRLDPMPQLWSSVHLTPESPTVDAVELLSRSIRSGATVVAIGPFTNLARLADQRPQLLPSTPLVVMGGWVQDLEDDLPAWGPGRDWNISADLDAARTVFDLAGDLTLVTLHETLRTHLRRADLARLWSAGPIGVLLAEQAETYAAARGHTGLAAGCSGLPDDLLVFLHDPLACAVAAGWPGAPVSERRLRAEEGDGGLRLVADQAGRPVRVVTGVDGTSFAQRWLSAVELSAERHDPGRPTG